MADEIEIANDRAMLEADTLVSAIRQNAEIPPGVEGECESCGEQSKRLIGGDCARCRDGKDKLRRNGFI